ncbi:MAG: SCP2 sterol-binding domain-containing protein [Bacillota bacterium]
MASLKERVMGLQATLEGNAQKNKGITGAFQFDISGDDGGQFFFQLNDGAFVAGGEGTHDNPNITVSMNSADFLDMLDGKLNGTMAFMSGKLKIKGDMALAMKLEGIIK